MKTQKLLVDWTEWWRKFSRIVNSFLRGGRPGHSSNVDQWKRQPRQTQCRPHSSHIQIFAVITAQNDLLASFPSSAKQIPILWNSIINAETAIQWTWFMKKKCTHMWRECDMLLDSLFVRLPILSSYNGGVPRPTTNNSSRTKRGESEGKSQSHKHEI